MAMFVVICLLVFGTLKGLDVYTQHGVSVEVPNVIGLSEQEAGMLLHNHELDYEIVDSNYVKTELPGRILDQNPSAGSKVKKGRVVYFTINSLSTPLRMVPDVADNSSLRQAQAKLLASGFKLEQAELISGEKDWVYGVKYNGRELRSGDKVPEGATLVLLVGNGSREDISIEDSLSPEVEATQLPVTSQEAVVDDSWF